jgi:hypothetical protein
LLDYFHLTQSTEPPVTNRMSCAIYMDIRTHVESQLTVNPGRFDCGLTHDEVAQRLFGIHREPASGNDGGCSDTAGRPAVERTDPAGEDSDRDESGSPLRGLIRRIRPEGSRNLEEYQGRPPQVVVVCAEPGSAGPAAELKVAGGVLTFNPITVVSGMANLTTPRGFQVVLDGQIVADLQPGEKCSVDTSSGSHALFIKASFGKSRTIRFDVENGQRVLLSCQGQSVGRVLLRRID